ncbi:STAS domain-containing protein [Niveibacterium sp. SC-1]|uniref:STAS domain-containing protein n=1 Tax=Niveibacterium sp. SC-1 TaxID=3135646 RepID=UPI00311D8AA9
MEANVSFVDGKGVMKLAGRFDFNSHREYRDALNNLIALDDTEVYVVDLASVNYLDSSALGMLLLLRDKARQAGKEVSLSGVQGSVREVLEIANFGKMFSIG